MNKKERILAIAKERLEKGDITRYYKKFNNDTCALIYGIAEYRREQDLHCTWEDVICIIGEIFNKKVNENCSVIEQEILRIVGTNFSLDNLLLGKVMNNE
jgi:hypothetical protein